MRTKPLVRLVAALIAFGCVAEEDGKRTEITFSEADEAATATAYWAPDTLSSEAIARGRRDTLWRTALGGADTIPWESTPPADPDSVPSESLRLDDVEPAPAESLPAVALPLAGDTDDLSVLHVQTLLDRAGFSPGVLDDRWGKNTEKAVYWLQRSRGLEATGRVDSITFRHLTALAGASGPYVRTVELNRADVSGPFVDVPEDPYRQARLDCLCYRSASEKLSERFHTTPELLSRLNPEATLDSLAAGDTLRVPNVEALDLPDDGGPGDSLPSRRRIARIVVSDRGGWLQAIDAGGRIVYHFPATLGSRYAPSPDGEFEIVSVAFEPRFHFQPKLFDEVADSKPDIELPPGPNNPVGVVWMKLSKPHYGIHGTARPETIGYVTSHGCVRLTNWDARFLAERVGPGTPVDFVDLDQGREEGDERSRPAAR